jgi:hypothetical protein
VHVDQSYAGAEIVLRTLLPAEAESILSSGKRWQIINLWRPIATIYKDPLAIAAAHLVAEEDLVKAKVVYKRSRKLQARRRFSNATWAVLPSEKHEWFYKNEQRPDEVWFIKCLDSRIEEGLARRAPHCAFRDTEREADRWRNRESVDVRALVFYD